MNDPLATRALPAESPRLKSRLVLALGAVGLIVVALMALLVLRAPRSAVPNNPPPNGVPPNSTPAAPLNDDVAAAIEHLRQAFTQANAAALQGQANQARSQFADVAAQAERQLNAPSVAPEQQTQLRVIAGESWLAANEAAKAQAQFEALVQQAPTNAEWHTGVAAALLLQGNLDAADVALNRALRVSSDYAAAHALRACVLLKRNEPLLAVREFRQSGLADLKAPVPPWVRLVLADLDCRTERFR